MSRKAIIAGVAILALGQSPNVDPLLHRQLKWTGSCAVDFASTACRTVRYHESAFGPGLGFEGTTYSECVDAVDHTGSESNTRSSVLRRFYLFPRRTLRITELVLRTENRTVYIDHERKVYESHMRGANKGNPYWEEDDSQCSHTASHSTYLSGRLPDSTIAGVHVVGYRGKDLRGADYELYFAPSIGCQTLLFREVIRGPLGWKTAEYEKIVDSYEIGPPATSLFAIPNGYKQVESIQPPSP